MDRVAVFVDAGYLFAQGSTLLSGQNTSRQLISINEHRFMEKLTDFLQQEVKMPLLRVYWYDGMLATGALSTVQSRLGLAPNIKLRLGQVNGSGQQKGVDAMIVTDMIELARNKAIADAVLIGGDDDLRVGVQVSQTYGVRVHLLGFAPAHTNQNRWLRQEADTLSEWGAAMVGSFLSVQQGPAPIQASISSTGTVPAPVASTVASASDIESAVAAFVAPLNAHDLNGIQAYWASNNNRGIPQDIDRLLLKAVSTAIQTTLDDQQKRFMRQRFHLEISPRLQTVQSASST
ncbi:NYN domain-containing protein (plasmid) [Azospirillum oryzae]|uniref:NYN domain-containing protein n=1 Tax=Azospirillum oryzae TaxID=286727 RepID=A0A6N1APW7_9PROT|nr:NYN domain-containing protein [Azospirillum oryzae]QKS50172.1 NYN domain-containing protein [Azospirillum oryzae]